MLPGNELSAPSRILLTTASVIILIAGMRAAADILSPLLMAAFLAIISAPPILWLQRRGAPKPVAFLIVIGILVGIGATSVSGIRNSVTEINQSLPVYEERLAGIVTSTTNTLKEVGLIPQDARLKNLIDPTAVIGIFGDLINNTGALIGNLFLIVMALLFILVESTYLPRKLSWLLEDRHISIGHLSDFTDTVNRYFLIKTGMSLITGLFVAIWLHVLGVDFAVLWGWLAFFLNFVPYIGSIMAAIPAVLIALLGQNAEIALWAALGYVIANIVVGNLLEPRFLGRGLGLSTLVVFLSMVFWGWVLGGVGMFLSAPLTMLVKIAAESDPKSRWLGVLLGTASELKPVSRGHNEHL